MPEFDFADIKPSVLNMLMITLIVVITIPLLKAFVNRFDFVPDGVTNLVNAV